MNFILLLALAVTGPFVLGALAVRHGGGTTEKVLMVIAGLFPLLVAGGVWISHYIAWRNGDLFGTSSDGDMVVLVVAWGSVLLVPVSCSFAFFGREVAKSLSY